MEETKEFLTVESIRNCVYVIRGQQVMLDQDLAEIYGYELKAMNQQVKRNIERFPEDFMFQLAKEEVEIVKENLKSQIVTSSWGGKRKLPYAFTEQGIYMLATVLKGDLAVQQSIFIMRAFKEMRHYIRQNQQFVTQAEMDLVTARVSEISVQVAGVIDHQVKTNKAIEDIQKSIHSINENFVSDNDFKNFVIYKGQKFEADAAYIEIYQQAQKSIYVIDDYVNTKTLQLLSQKKHQYPPFRIKPNPDCHDRWIILDYGLPDEKVFHCGASSKDAGRKLCAINAVGKTSVVHDEIDSLLLAPDKTI